MRISKHLFLMIIFLTSFKIPTLAQDTFAQIINDFFKTNISETYFYDITIEDTKIYVNQLTLRYMDQELSRFNWEREIRTVFSSLYTDNNHTIKTNKNKYDTEVSKLIRKITQLKIIKTEQSTTEELKISRNDVTDNSEKEDKTELDKLSTEIQELKAEIQNLNERNKLEKELHEEELRKEKEAAKDSLLRYEVSNIASNYVGDNAPQILNKAYPLAMNKLRWKNIEFLGASKDNSHYNVTIRLNYFNLMRKLHYLDLRFKFDLEGQFDSWKFVNHSDVIAPREITIGKLLRLD